ncbi:MAG: DNA polymerase III subunit alpha, partial [bacterium]
AAKVASLIKRVKELDMPSLALTDHGNMYAAVEFYMQARDEGIKPIIGCETYMAPRTRFDCDPRIDRSSFHLTLLAKDEEGYRNLLKLVSAAYLEGFYQKPRVDTELLEKFHKGLVAMSGCMAGEIPSLLLAGEDDLAHQRAGVFKDIFGPDFYLEIMDQGFEEQKVLNPKLIELSKTAGISLVATNDIHYIKRDDAKTQDILLCIQTGKTLGEEKRMKFSGEEFYLKSASEMKKLFSEIPEAITNSAVIADKCNLDLQLGRMYLPQFTVPAGETANSDLEKRCYEGASRIYGQNLPSMVDQRLKYELDVIERMGYAAYFLIVWDFVKYSRENGIQVGPGRGSAAGSIVSYVLGITLVDPLKYGLIFERFLNPERVSMPDIDIDFCIERRAEVIDYITQKYGSDHVAQIITFGTMAARGVIRDVGRVLNVPLPEVDRVAKMVPSGPDMSIDKGLETNKEFAKLYSSDLTVRNLVDTAKKLEGFVRHASVHAAGVVISQNPLTDHVPLRRMNETQLVTQYQMGHLEKIGLLKMDCLGLRNLTMMDATVRSIEKNYGIKLDMLHIPLDDQKTYKMLSDGETTGIFQLESRGMRSLIKRLNPEKIEDIIDLIALHRPGPLESGMVDDYIDRKKGTKKWEYEIPELRSILEDTYGVIVYQEQVMQIASKIAGFTMGQADVLRSAMGKKKEQEMNQQKERFLEGAVKAGVSPRKAASLFNLCSKFAGYGFNKSHSTSYAFISYHTAYLKANYPIEFMAALLTSIAGNIDKVSFYISECRRMGVPVLPPDVNESLVNFTPLSSDIRFGLAAVKNVGLGAIESIIESRKEGPFKSMQDFMSRVDLRLVNKRVVESLVKTGAMDSLGRNRAALIAGIDRSLIKGQKLQKEKAAGQSALFAVEPAPAPEDDNGPEEDIPDFSMEQKLRMEKEMLGFYISGHPLSPVQEILSKRTTVTIDSFSDRKEGDQVVVGGMLTGTRKLTTKKNDLMLIGNIEDLTGKVNIVVFPKTYEKFSQHLSDDRIVVLKGKIDQRNEEWQVVVEDVESLESEEQKKYLHIDPAGKLSRENLENIRLILSQHKGTSQVFIHCDGTKVKVGDDFCASITPKLMLDIERLLGRGSVWMEYEKKTEGGTHEMEPAVGVL